MTVQLKGQESADSSSQSVESVEKVTRGVKPWPQPSIYSRGRGCSSDVRSHIHVLTPGGAGGAVAGRPSLLQEELGLSDSDGELRS